MKDLEKHYIMKGVGKPQYYLGGDVFELREEWNKEGIYTAFSAETYIKNSLGKLATMCGKPNFPDKKMPFVNSRRLRDLERASDLIFRRKSR